ncbi:hypothetical protein CKAN_02764800 [Cinnamomum micranthum f. kanehirae]|uniref:Uncharacterized protein n=1 Tax=Cinnamomum micranthum f. kanehirae TaxID=337451 RepID=A0A443Q557_9MAGN|nr:hypothetical protein CKAN_02764800 [Cinnamomum micranthum f. kanehirae]
MKSLLIHREEGLKIYPV